LSNIVKSGAGFKKGRDHFNMASSQKMTVHFVDLNQILRYENGKNCLSGRVTRLGGFSPIERWLTSAVFFENYKSSPNFLLCFFPTVKALH
jgi:hypothetical protein